VHDAIHRKRQISTGRHDLPFRRKTCNSGHPKSKIHINYVYVLPN
jgi:hypothetical protein